MPETRRRPGPAPKISRDAVLDVARELEPEDLTLAAIGAKLGVTGPALYRYFPDRTAILEALANEAREKLVPPDPSLPWDEWMREAAGLERALWRAHGDLYEAANYRAISKPTLGMCVAGVQVLTAAGFTTLDAFCAMTLITEVAHSVGWSENTENPTLVEPEDVSDLLIPLLVDAPVLTIDVIFDQSLEIAIEGLRARLANSPKPAKKRKRTRSV
ncbi:MAG TPA: TetR family transcriptional regulator [Mycobacteriales bacterium]|nr:TetR family transcriptional regulator [Mycobacteriales bacterium]